MSWRNTGRSFRERNDSEYTNSFDDLSALSDVDADIDADSDDQNIDTAMADSLVDLDDVLIDDEAEEDLFAEISFRRSERGSGLAYE